MSSTPGIIDNSDATAITIGSDESVTLTGNMLHAGDFTLDVAGDISLDADGQDIRLKDAGTEWGRFTHTGHFGIQNPVSDADIQFIGSDGGSTITALTLDMSEAGAATFNDLINIGGSSLNFTKADGVGITAKESLAITIDSDNNDSSRVFSVLDGNGTTLMQVTDAGEATFNAGVTATGLTINPDADSSLSIADGGTNAIVIKAAAGDELYIGANDTYAIRVLNDGTNDVVLDNGSNLTVVGSIGVTQADGDYLVKIHETNADGYVDLFTGEATPVIRTRITSYGTNYFTPTGANASNMAAVSIGSATGAKAGVLNIDSSSTSIAGGIRHRMGGGTQYLNTASTQTGSGSVPYWHIKTNAFYNNNIMFVARVHGYAYGNAGHIVDMQRSGYAYSGSSTTIIATQFVNNGSSTSDTLVPYYTSAGQLCFRAFAGSSSYYTGLAFDIKMQSPTGFDFDFVIIEHVMNATSGNHY